MKNTLLLFIGLFACTTLLCMEDDEERYQQDMLHQYADRCYPKGKLERLIKSRVEAGKSIDFKNIFGETPFIAALRVGNAKAAKLFIEAGCDYTHTDRDGKNALNLAAQAGDVETVKILLAKNVPLDQCDKEGETPLHSLVHRGKWLNQPYAAVELQAYQALCAEQILLAARKQNKDISDLLNKKDYFEKTAVQLAELGNICVLSTFIEYCPEVEIYPGTIQCIAETHLRCMRLLRYEITRNNQQKERVEQVFNELDNQFKKIAH